MEVYLNHAIINPIRNPRKILKTNNNKVNKFFCIGLALWFKTDFFNYTEDKWTNVSLNTSPQFPPTHWKQTIVPFFHENEENDSGSRLVV